MKISQSLIGCLAVIVLIAGCAVMPPEIQDKALPPLALNELIANIDQYKGQTVILGGYIVSVENQENQTRIVAVQTTLGVGQKPNSKDLSQGRLIIIYNGFLDPEVYTKDRQITVGGRVLGSSANDPRPAFPYLKIELEDIHLWPVEKPAAPYPYWDDDYWYPYFYPWWWHHPYWHHHYR
jgi:outer membrane lipoprotein